jgi:DNA-binding transcriptional regulator YhcF (GntR family)
MITIDNESSNPIYQQVADQIHFAINTGALKPGEALPSIRKLAASTDLASNTIVKALKSLESSGLIEAKDRSGYKVSNTMTPGHLETQESSPASNRYQARGVSAEKTEVHSVVDKLDAALNTVRSAHPGYEIAVTGLSAIAARNSAGMIEKLTEPRTGRRLAITRNTQIDDTAQFGWQAAM